MDLLNDLKRIANEAKRFITGTLPKEVGKMAEDHFRESFQNEGFTDESLVKWPEVERRKEENQRRVKDRKTGRSKSRHTRKQQTSPILTDTGDLGDSIRWDQTKKGEVVIATDVVYAQIHNDGGMAGRGNKVKIPKRQFMGPSKQLEEKIEKKLIRGVDLIFEFKDNA